MSDRNFTQTKYANLAQFFCGVTMVNDTSLSQGERLALVGLAAFADYRTALAHPGNSALMRATGCKSRQGINYIVRRLIDRGLIQMVSKGDGGRGLATVYRLSVEDERFPMPKPATDNLRVSESKNLQVQPAKPATSGSKTRKPELDHILKIHPLVPSNPTEQPADDDGGWEILSREIRYCGKCGGGLDNLEELRKHEAGCKYGIEDASQGSRPRRKRRKPAAPSRARKCVTSGCKPDALFPTKILFSRR